MFLKDHGRCGQTTKVLTGLFKLKQNLSFTFIPRDVYIYPHTSKVMNMMKTWFHRTSHND